MSASRLAVSGAHSGGLATTVFPAASAGAIRQVAVCLGIADKIEPGDKLEGYGYDPDRAQILPMRLGDVLDALEADSELADVLRGYFVSSFLAYKRIEIERFERFVTDWEFREYAYHL
jgi:glutamine synthetase